MFEQLRRELQAVLRDRRAMLSQRITPILLLGLILLVLAMMAETIPQ